MKDKSLKELINELVDEKMYVPKLCKVMSVTNDECEVEPYDDTSEIKARLKVKTGIMGGLLIEPKINSDVLVMFAEKGSIAFIVGYSEIMNVKLKTEAKISISNNAQNLKDILNDLLQEIVNLKMAHPQGPTTGVLNAFNFVALKQRINLLID